MATAKGKTIISISAKCGDLFSATLEKDGQGIGEYSGYVPGFFPEKHYGDCVILSIDIETGMIVNWKKPTQAQLDKVFKKEAA